MVLYFSAAVTAVKGMVVETMFILAVKRQKQKRTEVLDTVSLVTAKIVFVVAVSEVEISMTSFQLTLVKSGRKIVSIEFFFLRPAVCQRVEGGTGREQAAM